MAYKRKAENWMTLNIKTYSASSFPITDIRFRPKCLLDDCGLELADFYMYKRGCKPVVTWK